MDSQLIAILVAAAIVIAGTFVLKKVLGSALKVAGLAVVAFLGRREDVGADGFGWMEPYDGMIILSAAVFAWITGMVMNAFVFREDGFGRHFFVPLIAVAMAYVAALLIDL